MVRIVNKLIDEYMHNSCTILTFATAFRPWFAGLSAGEIDQRLAKAPSKKHTEYKREHHEKLLNLIEQARGGWLAGGEFSLADIEAIPYVLRLDLLKMARSSASSSWTSCASTPKWCGWPG